MSQAQAKTKEEVLALLGEGAELWFFPIEGGVGIHDQCGKPMDGYPFCPIEVFKGLEKQGLIEYVGIEIGQPYYHSGRVKPQVYRLKKEMDQRSDQSQSTFFLAVLMLIVGIPLTALGLYGYHWPWSLSHMSWHQPAAIVGIILFVAGTVKLLRLRRNG